MVTCPEDGCQRPVKSGGRCQMHYMRWYRYGTTATPSNAKRPKDIPFADWFWSHFQPNGGCLDWTRTTVGIGYGHVRYEGRMRRTHVVSWILTNGPVPDGLHVLHTCDRPICGNPAHLWLGTIAENNADKARKGRSRGNPSRGEDGRFSYA